MGNAATDIIEDTEGEDHNYKNELIAYEYDNDADPELSCEEKWKILVWLSLLMNSIFKINLLGR